MRGEGVRVRVRCDDGSDAHVDGAAHRIGRHMGDVDEHAEPVHLPDHGDAELAEAAVTGHVGRRVGPLCGVHVRQCHVPDPGVRQFAEHGEGTLDAVAPLGADQACRSPASSDRNDLVGRHREGEPGGVPLRDEPHQPDLVSRCPQRSRRRGRDVDRPELCPDASGSQAGDVGVELGERTGGIGCCEIAACRGADRPRQVVVAVDDGQLVVEATSPCRVIPPGRHSPGSQVSSVTPRPSAMRFTYA